MRNLCLRDVLYVYTVEWRSCEYSYCMLIHKLNREVRIPKCYVMNHLSWGRSAYRCSLNQSRCVKLVVFMMLDHTGWENVNNECFVRLNKLRCGKGVN